MMMLPHLLFAIAIGVVAGQPGGNVKKENVDENKVPPYTLPDPLVDSEGKRIATSAEWMQKRRPEILNLFEAEVYGRAPKEVPQLEFHLDTEKRDALGGHAIRKEVTILVSTSRGRLPLHLLLYTPISNRPVPVFLGLNFHGNQGVSTEPDIELAKCWIINRPEVHGIVDNHATDA